mgnify:CR=1 FL=1
MRIFRFLLTLIYTVFLSYSCSNNKDELNRKDSNVNYFKFPLEKLLILKPRTTLLFDTVKLSSQQTVKQFIKHNPKYRKLK